MSNREARFFAPPGVDEGGKACYAEDGMKSMKFSSLLGGAKTVVMLGMCKNAGKTTALCRLIREFGETDADPPAATSIGRDGETRDLVTGTEKPPIYMYEGMLAATARELLPLADVSREILAGTGLYTSLGEVMIFRAKSDGFVQLAGPGIVEHLEPLKKMLKALGAGRILIDGALSRRSPAAAASGGAIVLSTGASLDRDMDTVIAETAFAAGVLSLPAMEAPGAQEGRYTLFHADGSAAAAESPDALTRGSGRETLLVAGAFSEAQARRLLLSPASKEDLTVLVRDAACLMIRRETCEALQKRGVRFALQQTARLAAVTVNPVSAGGWSFPAEEFRERMAAAVRIPVIDTKRKEDGDDGAYV